jgi:hypothetical protein
MPGCHWLQSAAISRPARLDTPIRGIGWFSALLVSRRVICGSVLEFRFKWHVQQEPLTLR